MIYSDFQGKKLSALGFGAMRLPILDQKESEIDVEAVKAMVGYAMENGINYYDTAWGYHEGNSERVMGEDISKAIEQVQQNPSLLETLKKKL